MCDWFGCVVSDSPVNNGRNYRRFWGDISEKFVRFKRVRKIPKPLFGAGAIAKIIHFGGSENFVFTENFQIDNVPGPFYAREINFIHTFLETRCFIYVCFR